MIVNDLNVVVYKAVNMEMIHSNLNELFEQLLYVSIMIDSQTSVMR